MIKIISFNENNIKEIFNFIDFNLSYLNSI